MELSLYQLSALTADVSLYIQWT